MPGVASVLWVTTAQVMGKILFVQISLSGHTGKTNRESNDLDIHNALINRKVRSIDECDEYISHVASSHESETDSAQAYKTGVSPTPERATDSSSPSSLLHFCRTNTVLEDGIAGGILCAIYTIVSNAAFRRNLLITQNRYSRISFGRQ